MANNLIRLTVLRLTPEGSYGFTANNMDPQQATNVAERFLRWGSDVTWQARVKNLSQVNTQTIRRKARKHRELVLGRQKYLCAKCGSGQRLTLHHVIPISKGGNSDPGNLEGLCWPCHRQKHR